MKKLFSNKYPTVNYIGNKEKLNDWICEHIPSDVQSITDAFSGGSSFGYEAKTRGLRVVSNDVLIVNSMISRALIENNSTTLSDDDIEVIFKGKPKRGFMTKTYSNVFYFEYECMELDLYSSNIKKLNSDYKKALAYALMRRAMVRKMPYSRFTINWETIQKLRDEEYSYETYGRRRAYHNQSFKEHFLNNLKEYNNSIFNNGKENVSLNLDVFDLLKYDEYLTDAIYLDPPYAGTMNDYHSFYGLLDDFILGRKTSRFDNDFMSKKDINHMFDTLFSKLGNYKYWILSYNNSAKPSKEKLLELLEKYSSNIQIIEKEHTYKVTGKEKKNETIEYLFVVKNT